MVEISLISVLLILLVATNKLSQLMQESALNDDDVNYVNILGWAAAWILCVFNALSFLMIILDYIFDFANYLQKRKERLKNNISIDTIKRKISD
jgi:hypothetical protein